MVLKFRERGVGEYLAALYQKNVCVSRARVPASLHHSLKLLPRNCDMWQMTFGLIALESELVAQSLPKVRHI